jgi:hypothetical protein
VVVAYGNTPRRQRKAEQENKVSARKEVGGLYPQIKASATYYHGKACQQDILQ